MMYLGLPGNLHRIRSPLTGLQRIEDDGAVELQAEDGPITLQYMGEVIARWPNAIWPGLNADELGLIRYLARTHRGTVPLVMFDEARANLLSFSQSTGGELSSLTSVLDPDPIQEFQESNGTLTFTDDHASSGTHCVSWALGLTPTAGDHVALAWKHSEYGHAVAPNLDYVFRTAVSSNDATIRVRADIVWRTAAGSEISVSSLIDHALSGDPDDWTTVWVTGKSPATAAYAQLRVVLTNAVASKTVFIDDLQVELGSTLTPWKPGIGLPAVGFSGLDVTLKAANLFDLKATIVTVG